MLNKINFGDNVINLHFGAEFDSDVPLNLQEYSLIEDILLAEYVDYSIDVGWYPEFDLNGHFSVMIVKNDDWENPIMKKECRTLTELRLTIDDCVSKVNN
jgi:hypothetical protein